MRNTKYSEMDNEAFDEFYKKQDREIKVMKLAFEYDFEEYCLTGLIRKKQPNLVTDKSPSP